MRAAATARRLTALDKLYHIDTDEDLLDCLNIFKSTVKGYFKLSSKKEEEALINAIASGDKAIDPTLYRQYGDNLRKAVNSVPVDDKLQGQWQVNVSRFAAYKAYIATDRIRTAVREDGDLDKGRSLLHAFNRYQAAEYNTAVARARTGKQWLQFEDDDNKTIFPNIRWLPSRSATPREEHMPFYNRVWPKDDPFWTYNQPGTLWNCKCDWEQTDEEPTDGNPTKRITKPGLNGNPAKTGQIFSDDNSYINDVGKNETKIVEDFFRPIIEHHKEFVSYKDDPNYNNVAFDWGNGGVMATHKGHIDHNSDKEERFFGLSSTQLEQACQKKLYDLGHRSILLDESQKSSSGDPLPALDLRLDGKIMDIRSITSDKEFTIRNVLLKKNNQIERVFRKTGVESDSVCLYYYHPEYFHEEWVKGNIEAFKNTTFSNGKHVSVYIKHIYIVLENSDKVIQVDIK